MVPDPRNGPGARVDQVLPDGHGVSPGRQRASVLVYDDSEIEPDETFTLTSKNPTGATLGDAVATGTIVDDDEEPLPPLTASFENVPASHDGETEFGFELRFSENFPGRLPYRKLKDQALQATNGQVTGVQRVTRGQNQRWTITVRPLSGDEVTVTLPAAEDCAATGAICTEAGRKLSNTASATIAFESGDTDPARVIPDRRVEQQPAIGLRLAHQAGERGPGAQPSPLRQPRRGSHVEAVDLLVDDQPSPAEEHLRADTGRGTAHWGHLHQPSRHGRPAPMAFGADRGVDRFPVPTAEVEYDLDARPDHDVGSRVKVTGGQDLRDAGTPPMQLYRGWNARYAPEHTGRIRLCKATFYRDIDPSQPAIHDEQEGETRVLAQGSVTRNGSELPEMTLTTELDDGKVSGVAHLKRGQTKATLEQNLHAEVQPVPYIFCTSRKPSSPDEAVALKRALSDEYDAWYTVKDAHALGRELEKAIKGWLFDHRVTEHRLNWRHGWVRYYEGETPEPVADITSGRSRIDLAHHLKTMEPWFNKQSKYRDELEYRYAFALDSPQWHAFPDCICVDLTMAAIALFETDG